MTRKPLAVALSRSIKTRLYAERKEERRLDAEMQSLMAFAYVRRQRYLRRVAGKGTA